MHAFESEKKREILALENRSKSKRRKRDEVPDSLLEGGDDETSGPWAPYVDTKAEEWKRQMEERALQYQAEYAALAPSSELPPTSTVPAKAPEPAVISADAATTFIVEPEEEDEKWEKKNEKKLGGILPPR